MKKDSQAGVVTLEACVSVLSFLLLMILLSSLFFMFMAQNVTAHTVLQTAQSLSFDTYTIEKMKLDNGKVGSIGELLGSVAVDLFGSPSENPYFVSNTRWHSGDKTELTDILQKRFIGYISGGDPSEADAFLKNLNVVGGLSGLDFSESSVEEDVLYIVLRYELEYEFTAWGMGVVEVEQKACAKLWK